MSSTILQVPVDKEVRDRALSTASDMGFSSLQEAVRIFLRKLADKEMAIRVEEKEKAVQLSPRAIKRYDKISEDFKKGRNIYTAKDVEDLIRRLNK